MLDKQEKSITKEYISQFLERKARTPSAVSYRFKIEHGLNFTAGQYMIVDLGNELIHPLSLSNSPEQTEFIEFTKRMTGSPFCRRLESLQKGDTIKVKGPLGHFRLTEPHETIVMLAGGIGITPLMSILSSLEKTKKNIGKIILVYGNLNKEDIVFRNELENLKLQDYRLVHVLSDTTGMENVDQGYITADIIAREAPNRDGALFMISGPPVMVEAMEKALASINVTQDQIRTDIFFGYH